MTNLKEINNLNKINLQLFADAEGGADDSTKVDDTTQTSTDAKSDDKVETKTYTDEEVQKMIQAEADKRVTSALSKKEKEYQKQLEDEQRKSTLTQEELAKEKQLELDERENQIKSYELKLAKLDYFKSKEYDIELLDFVVGNDEDEIKSNSDALVEIVNKAVEKVVSERLKEKSSTPPSSQTTRALTMEDVKNMNEKEISKNWEAVQEVLKNNK